VGGKSLRIWSALPSPITLRDTRRWVLSSGGHPTDSTFRYLFLQVDVARESAGKLQGGCSPQIPGGAMVLFSSCATGKTLRGSMSRRDGGGGAFIFSVTLYSKDPGCGHCPGHLRHP